MRIPKTHWLANPGQLRGRTLCPANHGKHRARVIVYSYVGNGVTCKACRKILNSLRFM
jgi:hypothetical protein